MERNEFYAVNCEHPQKVIVSINKVDPAIAEEPVTEGLLVKTCKRINLNASYSIELHFDQPISATCKNTKCQFHAFNRDSEVPA